MIGSVNYWIVGFFMVCLCVFVGCYVVYGMVIFLFVDLMSVMIEKVEVSLVEKSVILFWWIILIVFVCWCGILNGF